MALNKLYGSQNQYGYPLGKYLVFVPNLQNSRFPETTKKQQQYTNAISLQKGFFLKTLVSTLSVVNGLDLVLNSVEGRASLRQVLMGTRLPSKPNHSLFTAVDEDYRFYINLAYNQKYTNEALSFIASMPLALECTYSPCVCGCDSQKKLK